MVINCARNTGYQTWSVRAVFYLLLHMTQPRIGNDKDEHIHLTIVEYNKIKLIIHRVGSFPSQ